MSSSSSIVAFNEPISDVQVSRAWCADCSLAGLPRRNWRPVVRNWKFTLTAAALLMLVQMPALAALIAVSPATPPSIGSDGKCSLLEAITNANSDSRIHLDCVAGSGVDTVVLPAKSYQQLNGEEILITSRIVIDGRGSTILRSRVNEFYKGVTFFYVQSNGDLTLRNLTVSGSTAGFYGYGVYNQGRLALDDSSITRTSGLMNVGGVAALKDSRVTDNVPPSGYLHPGGGILNLGATLVVTNSVISRNAGSGMGGGIFNDANSTATLTDSVVAGNRVTLSGHGGGIANQGTLLVVGTDIAGNEASETGAGIFNEGTATVRRSTISGGYVPWRCPTCWGAGGGVDNRGRLTLTNSTVSNNHGDVAYGGGVLSYQRTGPHCPCADPVLVLLDSTVTGNSAESAAVTQYGGGVYVESGTLTLERSVISGNQASTGREIFVTGTVVSDEYNLFGHDGDAGVSGFTPGSTDIVPNTSIDGILLPLADNGGGVKTHALAIGSPALDASPNDPTCAATDQRGNPRPLGPACDIGSFEGVAVLCNGLVTTMVGTIGNDRLTGTPGPDVIGGLSGDDVISGRDGDDVICAGSGADLVYGGPRNDLLFGEPGDDRLFGQGGNDTLNGGAGQDQCDGGGNSPVGDDALGCEAPIRNVP